MPAQVEDAKLEAAFRALHGPRLHGFALLVALGEAGAAERASPAAARRLTARARDRYLHVVEGQSAGQSGLPPTQPEGVLAMRIREIASRAISPGWKAE